MFFFYISSILLIWWWVQVCLFYFIFLLIQLRQECRLSRNNINQRKEPAGQSLSLSIEAVTVNPYLMRLFFTNSLWFWCREFPISWFDFMNLFVHTDHLYLILYGFSWTVSSNFSPDFIVEAVAVLLLVTPPALSDSVRKFKYCDHTRIRYIVVKTVCI